MASGHASRANRPNTWLHRPATRRDVLTCQLGASTHVTKRTFRSPALKSAYDPKRPSVAYRPIKIEMSASRVDASAANAENQAA
jgi:hypothetical protein